MVRGSEWVGAGSILREMNSLTGKESIKLDQKFEIRVVTLGRLAVPLFDVVAIKIDTYPSQSALISKISS